MELEILKETELINTDKYTTQTKYYKAGNRRFKIHFKEDSSNNSYFNSKLALSQYSFDEGKWNYLDDDKILNISHYPFYTNKAECLLFLKEFFQKMEEHLKIVYL